MTEQGESSRQRILAAIPRLTERLGYAPTLKEIATEVSLSRSGTYKHLTQLRDAGKVALRRRFAGWSIV